MNLVLRQTGRIITLMMLFRFSIASNMATFNGEQMLKMVKLFTTASTHYQKEIAPIQNKQPLDVNFNMVIADMYSMKDVNMHFGIECYLRLEWRDYRLTYNESSSEAIPFIFDATVSDAIWSPNIYFPNSKVSRIHEMQKKNIMFQVYPDGTVIMNEKVSTIVFCSMDMTFFPFDIQRCELYISDYSYPISRIRLNWLEPNVTAASHLHSQQFQDVKFNVSKTVHVLHGMNMTFDRLVVHLKLYRDLRIYVFRDLLPCMLIVMISWVTFWIDRNSAPARVCLGITTVLTIVSQTNNVHSRTVAPRNLRSIDIYLLSCLLFVFGALLEYALVGMTHRQPKKKWKKTQRKIATVNEDTSSEQSKNGDIDERESDTFHLNRKEDVISLHMPKKRTFNQPADAPIEVARNDKNSRSYELEDVDWDNVKRNACLRFFGPLVVEKSETHVVDQIAKVLFPFCFLCYNLIFFLYHYLHPNTVDS